MANDRPVPEPSLLARITDALSHGGYYIITVLVMFIGVIAFQIRADAVRDARLSELEKQVSRNSEIRNDLTALQEVVVEARRNVATFIERQTAIITRQNNDSERLNRLDTHVNELEGRTVTELKGMMDLMRQEMGRMEARQDKVAQALDTTYAALQEVLRDLAVQRNLREQQQRQPNR